MIVKKEYNVLLEGGELLEMYPELSGSWEKDEKVFTSIWEKNQEAIRDIEGDFDEFN